MGNITSVKYAVCDGNDLARFLVHQQGVIAHPHPDRAIGRRRQVVDVEIYQPIVAGPEGGGKEFAEAPAMIIPAGRATVIGCAKAAWSVEGAMIIAEAAEIMPRSAIAGAAAIIGSSVAIEVTAIEVPAIVPVAPVGAPSVVAAIVGRCGLDRGLCCRRRTAAAATPVSAAVETALATLLLRRGLMTQFRLGPVLHLRRDAGLADPVRVGLGADRRKTGRCGQQSQGGGRGQKSAHVTSP